MRGILVLAPEKEPEATGDPLLVKLTFVTKEVFPVPVSANVRLVMVAGTALVLVKTTCWTATLEAPGSWPEFPGGLGPWVACTTNWVGVEVGVGLGVAVEVDEAVRVGVWVDVAVGVLVAVRDAVSVGEAEGVALGVAVGEFDGVWVAVAVGVFVAVPVAVRVALFVGV